MLDTVLSVRNMDMSDIGSQKQDTYVDSHSTMQEITRRPGQECEDAQEAWLTGTVADLGGEDLVKHTFLN